MRSPFLSSGMNFSRSTHPPKSIPHAEPGKKAVFLDDGNSPDSSSETDDSSSSDASMPQFLLENVKQRIGFVGAGQMGEALIRGFIKAGMEPELLVASVRSAPRKQYFKEMGIRVTSDILKGGAEKFANASDVIFLAVKPQYMSGVVAALAPYIRKEHLIVTVAAGLKLKFYEQLMPDYARVIRVMPVSRHTRRDNVQGSLVVFSTHARTYKEERSLIISYTNTYTHIRSLVHVPNTEHAMSRGPWCRRVLPRPPRHGGGRRPRGPAHERRGPCRAD